MRNAGRLKLGFYPLPVVEANRLKAHLSFPGRLFSAVDPCVGDGIAFSALLAGEKVHAHGIELDGNRAFEAGQLGIRTWHADALEVRCPAETISLLYLNPPYDFEVGPSGNNKRMELVFLRHTFRWLVPGGVLLFVIPQSRLKECARLLAEQFTDISTYRLSEAESVRFNQIAVLAYRRRRDSRSPDAALSQATRCLESLSTRADLPVLSDTPERKHQVPASGPVVLKHDGLPLDEVEDLILQSAAYRQLSHVLLHQSNDVRGPPVTPLHGGHVGLLCTAGLLDGLFGEGEERHIARWRSTKYIDHWEEDEEDGGKTIHDCERFSQELTLLYLNGKTDILTHEKKTPSC